MAQANIFNEKAIFRAVTDTVKNTQRAVTDSEIRPGAATDTTENMQKATTYTTENRPRAATDTTENMPKATTYTTENRPRAATDTTENMPKATTYTTKNRPKAATDTTENMPKATTYTAENRPRAATDTTENMPKATTYTAENRPRAATDTTENRPRAATDTTENRTNVVTTENIQKAATDTTENIQKAATGAAENMQKPATDTTENIHKAATGSGENIPKTYSERYRYKDLISPHSDFLVPSYAQHLCSGLVYPVFPTYHNIHSVESHQSSGSGSLLKGKHGEKRDSITLNIVHFPPAHFRIDHHSRHREAEFVSTSPHDGQVAVASYKVVNHKKGGSLYRNPDAVQTTHGHGPPTVICYICGREYGTASIGIHEKQCLDKWRKENDKLPKKERRPEPVKRTLQSDCAVSGMTGNAEYDLNSINAAAYESYRQQFVKCDKCGRTFLPDRLTPHSKGCRGISTIIIRLAGK